jgi:hypothetical protein
VIDLSGAATATLRIVHSWQTEPGAGSFFDLMTVEVSANGGATWTEVWTRGAATSGGYITETLDVSAFTTSAFRIRLLFDSTDKTENDYAGWYLDEVTVLTD